MLGLDSRRDSVAIHARCGYLPGELELYPRMTGRQHARLVRPTHAAASTRAWRERARGALRGDPRPARPRALEGQPPEARGRARVHAPPRAADPRRTHLGARPADAGRVPPPAARDDRRRRAPCSSPRTSSTRSSASPTASRSSNRAGSSSPTPSKRCAAGRRRRSSCASRRRSRAAVFESLDGVAHVAVDGDRVTLHVTGELAPLLRVIADHDPVDVVARHADLDELFLTYYRDSPTRRCGLRSRWLDLHNRRRSTIGYAVGMALYMLVIVALYPAFKHSTGLDKLITDNPTVAAMFGVTGIADLTSRLGRRQRLHQLPAADHAAAHDRLRRRRDRRPGRGRHPRPARRAPAPTRRDPRAEDRDDDRAGTGADRSPSPRASTSVAPST